jgi:hypothetical protein
VEWLTIVAILLGPILAVQAQKWIEAARFNKNQRLFIFKRLMATRGTPISPVHVEALNLIDLEFAGRSEKHKQVRTRWKEYLDNLTRLEQDPQKQKEQLPAWSEKNQELLANLLHDMGKAVGYDFDTVHLKRSAYTPLGHANMELAGKKALALDVKSLPTTPELSPSSDDEPPQLPLD